MAEVTALICTGCGGPLVLSWPGSKLILTSSITTTQGGGASEEVSSAWCASCIASWNERMGAA